MAYMRRSKMPRAWPVPRKGKGQRYIALPSHSVSKGISLLFLLRDILKIGQTRKEVKHFVQAGDVKVNGIVRKDENFPLQIFDIMSLDKIKKNYKLEIVNRKFQLKEVPAKEVGKKVVKISGKKIVSGGAVQMNLEDGQNLIVKEKFGVGDSIVLNTIDHKVEKVLALKEGANVEIILGKHAGEKGKLKGFEKLKRGKNAIIKLEKGEVSLPLKTLLVIE